MDRDAEHKAFARAWRYLSYNATAKWTSLLAAIGHAILYVALLLLFWLFTDLIVNRGEIPRFAELSVPRREQLFSQWNDDPTFFKDTLKTKFGADEERAQYYLDNMKDETLRSREKEMLWRIYLIGVLRDKVGGTAPGTVLPAYHELPSADQQAFKKQWKEKADATWFRFLDFPSERIQELTGDPEKLSEGELDLIWRVFLHLKYTFSKQGREDYGITKYLRERLNREAAASEEALVVLPEENTLANRGILSLVVRTHLQGHVVSWFLGFIAVPLFYRTFLYYLTSLLVIAVVIACVRALLGFANLELAAAAAIEASTRMRRLVYHHTYRLGTLAIRELGPSEAVSIYARQVEAVHDGLYTWMTAYFREAIKAFLLLAFAVFVDRLLGLAFVFFAVLVWAIGGQLASYFQRKGRASANRAAEQLTLIRESLMLMRLVKVQLMELFNQARVERLLSSYATLQWRRYRGEAISVATLVFMGTLCILLLMFVAGLVVLQDQMGNSGVITLAATLVSLYFPLVMLRDAHRIVRRGREAAVAVFRFLDRPADIRAVADAQFLQPLSTSLEFDGVTLKEPGTNRLLLKDITLKINAGDKVGLIGVEESEKHAFVYLIPRFLDPTAGEIRVDDHKLRFVTLDSLRAQIAVVMQHNLVFHDTVANNINCGDKAYTQPQIIEAAKLAHAHNFIQKLPQGYETFIGELGHSLSVSQQFRIALARAILRDPALMIIEEPATLLDDDTKALIDDTYTRVLPGRTVIFLPHRISTIRTCDRLFLLHHGELEAAGSHRELLAKSPLYRHLHYLEFNEIAETA